MYIHCSCYMFPTYMGHYQATLIIWENHCTVHFVLSTLRHIVVVVVVGVVVFVFVFVNLLRKIFSSYLFQCSFLVCRSL
jgi:hypothetical protein